MSSQALTSRELVPFDPMDAPVLRHSRAAQVLLATMPFGFLVLGYAVVAAVSSVYDGSYAQGATNAVGFALHVSEPAAADRWLFGRLPTAWLQDHLYSAGQTHWYDAVAAIVYLSHFLVGPAIALTLWFRDRARFRSWVACVLAMAALGLITYIAYPMAPPWLAAEQGVVEPVHRVSNLGWEYLHLDVAASMVRSGQGTSNPVAAMPSLHVGFAVLAVVFLGLSAAWWQRLALATYPITMALTVVYTGEHYVVDGLVGAAYAVAVVLGWHLAQRRRAAPAISGAAAARAGRASMG